MPEPIESGCDLQPLSVRDLTAEHVGRRVKVGDIPASTLVMIHGFYQTDQVTVWLAKGSSRVPYTVAGFTPVQLDPPQEVSGD